VITVFPSGHARALASIGVRVVLPAGADNREEAHKAQRGKRSILHRPSSILSCFLSLLTLLGSTTLTWHAHAATLTGQTNQLGSTPVLLGYNSGHFYPGSNTREWWRYSGVTGARVFISPSNIEPSDDLAPVGDGVNSQATFLARRAAIRTNQFNSAYINWSVFTNNYQNNDLAGNNHIKVNFALGELRKLGIRICAQITASTSRLPLAGPTDWPNMWELWQHYYAQAFYLGRYFDVERYQMYNEPNHSPAVPQEDYMLRLRLASDAIQLALADVNSLYGKSLVPAMLAPVSSGSADSPYSSWGTMVVTNRHLDVLGQTDPAFWLLHVYDYHQYNASPASFGSGLANLRSLIAADMAPEAPFPVSITEFNTFMAASFDDMTDTVDSPTQYPRFGAVAVNLMANLCSELYCFKFSQTDYSGNYPVIKDAMHYVDNDAPPYNVGGVSKGGEVWRLFNKAFAPGRQRLDTLRGSGAASLDVHASYDPVSQRYYLFVANNTTSDISLDLVLGAWKIPTNNLVLVEEVSEGCYGAGRIWTNAGANRTVSATLGSNSVWLLTAPVRQQQPEQVVAVTDDAEVRDGANKGVNYGANTVMTVQNDPVNSANRGVAFLKFHLTATNLADLQFATLSVYASGTTNAPIQAHVYGLDATNWSQNTLCWSNAPNLKDNVAAGSLIANNIIDGLGTNAHLAGQLVVAATNAYERLIDVTDFIRGLTNADATFLISQDPRWNITLPSLNPGDAQAGGIRIVTQEGATSGTPGPRLRLAFNAVTNPPVGVWTNLTVATEAVVRGGVNAALDQDEVATGYILVKYYPSPYDSARKAYFQFDLGGLAVNPDAQATFTVTTFTQAFAQRVQLWGLQQAYPGFNASINWNSAQANELNSNNLLTAGPYTAAAIGDPAFIPGTISLPWSFTIPRIGDYLWSNRVTLVLSGAPDSGSQINNAGGLRLQRTNAILCVLFTPATLVTNAPQRATGIRANAEGSVTIDFLGGPLQTYAVQATTNPIAAPWRSIGTNTSSTNGTWSFTDPPPASYHMRFYRSALPGAP
jgi:hypothetical protein